MMRIAPGSGQEENTAQKAIVQELNWSHDQMFLAAVIHDTVAFFDMKKLLNSINESAEQKLKTALSRDDQINSNKINQTSNSMQIE